MFSPAQYLPTLQQQYVPATKIRPKSYEMYGNECLLRTPVYVWVALFQIGRENVDNDEKKAAQVQFIQMRIALVYELTST